MGVRGRTGGRHDNNGSAYLVEQSDDGTDGLDDFVQVAVDLEDTVGGHGAALAKYFEVRIGLLAKLLDLEAGTADDGAGMALMDEQPRLDLSTLALEAAPQVSEVRGKGKLRGGRQAAH